MILRAITIERFGYDPATLTRGSHRLVCVRCDECSGLFMERKFFSAFNGWRCISCRGRGNNPWVRGLKEKKGCKDSRRLYMRKWRQDPINKMLDRLRSSFNSTLRRQDLQKNGEGVLRKLGYTHSDLKDHFSRCQILGCNICGLPLEDDFHISHLVPASTAASEKELLALFHLSNLGLAHPMCNMKLRAKEVGDRAA